MNKLTMKKTFLLFVALCSTVPVIALDHKGPYIVDLYKAVKNHTGWSSYINWYSGAENAAVRRGMAFGESKAELYWQAAEYANSLGDAKTAVALKKSFARQESLPVMGLSIVWIATLTCGKLVYDKFSSVRATVANGREASKQAYIDAVARLEELKRSKESNKKKLHVQQLVLDILDNMQCHTTRRAAARIIALNNDAGPDSTLYKLLMLDEMQQIEPSETWWNNQLEQAGVKIEFDASHQQPSKDGMTFEKASTIISTAWAALRKEKPEYAQLELGTKGIYRKLAIRWSPDKNPGNAVAAAKFIEIKAAAELLLKASQA